MASYWLKYGSNVLNRNGTAVGKSNYDPYNPLGLPPYTIRAKFSSGYTPAMGDSQTLVDAGENIWDIVKVIDRYTGEWGQLFSGCSQLISVLGANTNGFGGYKKTISGLFKNCTNLEYVAPFDTSNAQWASQVFYGCTHLQEIPTIPLGSATDLSSMLYNCTSVRTLPAFDTSSALNLNGFVEKCSSLTEFPVIDCSHVTNMHQMFSGCSSLTTLPMLDTRAVTDMGSLCSGCSSLVSFPAWNTSACSKMGYMFYGATMLVSVPNISTALVDDMVEMFGGCSRLTSIPLMDTSSAVDMSRMWEGCTGVESGALALYQQASAQSNPPSRYSNCFYYTGHDTDPSAPIHSELAQIPTSWGGTMA